MIVKELIKKLQNLNENLEVLVSWDMEGPGDINSVETKNLQEAYSKDLKGYLNDWVEIHGSL